MYQSHLWPQWQWCQGIGSVFFSSCLLVGQCWQGWLILSCLGASGRCSDTLWSTAGWLWSYLWSRCMVPELCMHCICLVIGFGAGQFGLLVICWHFVDVFALAFVLQCSYGYQTYLREVWSLLRGASTGLRPGSSSSGSQSPHCLPQVVVSHSVFPCSCCPHVCRFIM